MTTDQLDALEPATTIYLPTIWEVQTWLFAGRVPGCDYFTLAHPPDQYGVISNRKPVYMHALDLLNATLSEKQAWEMVKAGLIERSEWVSRKLQINEHTT